MSHFFTLTSIEQAWRQLLPRDILFSLCPIPAAYALVSPAQLAKWQVGKHRQPSFNAGRLAAQHAIQQCGLPLLPPLAPQAGTRIPRWPNELRGSITHLREWACAVAAPSSRYSQLGIDVAPRGVFPGKGIQRLAKASERALVSHLADDVAARLLFSLKESAYKALAVDDRFIGFLQAELTALEGLTWRLNLCDGCGDDLPCRRVEGRWWCDE